MAHSSFGTGWPICDRSEIVTLARKDGLRLPVHRGLVDLVSILIDLTEIGHGYDVKPGQTWGYACRAIAGTSRPSNHSWGTAVDINAPSNPRRADRQLSTDIPGAVVDLWESHGFAWGGRWNWPDPMHFEFIGTLDYAAHITRRLRRFLGNAPTPPRREGGRPAPRPYPGVVGLWDGYTNGPNGNTAVLRDEVRVWQQVLRERGYGVDVDGRFGLETNHVVVDWQRKHRELKIDGVAGPATWHSLLYA